MTAERVPLRLFNPAAPAGCAQDCISCAHPPPNDDQPFREFFEHRKERHEKRPATVPQSQRQRVRDTSTVWQFWDEWIRPDRESDVAAKKISQATVEKERSVVRWFHAWELSHAPDDWPCDAPPWPGTPIGFLASGLLESFLANEAQRLAPASIESDWNHLRTVLNAAVKRKVLSEAPTADVDAVLEWAEDADEPATSYRLEELDALYRLLPTAELQVAFVVGANCGPRATDLFGLDWKRNLDFDLEPPHLRYTARKTDKRHLVPLAPVTLSHLDRLRAGRLFVEGPLFPTYMSRRAKDLGRNRPARRRTQQLKAALVTVGIEIKGDYRRPWQVLRSTASTRLNNHRTGVGRLLTHGPDADVNSQSYDDYRDRLTEAVLTVRQPEAFQL